MNNVNDFIIDNKCCGCGLCEEVCPVNAIKMDKNINGFIYPNIDEKICINCGKCKNKCAFNNHIEPVRKPRYYGVKNNSIDVRMKSRSGGVFPLLARKILEESGMVYGVTLNEQLLAEHACIENTFEIYRLQGSKYMQSRMLGVYESVKNSLNAQKKVLFSGTPCQVAALYKYLEKEDVSKLTTVDIICHGVPSPGIFGDFIRHLERKYKGNVSAIDFRNKKKYGWEGSVQTFTINSIDYDERVFIDLFTLGVIERESCFKCPYKSTNRQGDITIGDFWGINNVKKDFNDHKGVSLILCNSDKGQELFESIRNEVTLFETQREDCIQSALVSCNEAPSDRDVFLRKYKRGKINYAIRYWNLYRIKRKMHLIR